MTATTAPATTTARWPSLAREHGETYDVVGDDRAREDATLVDLLAGRARGLAESLRSDVTADSLPDAALRERFDALQGLIGAATTAQAYTVRALNRSGGMADDGASSPGAWLQAHGRLSSRDAARTARLAHRVDDLPETVAALASGAITAEAADVIVRAVEDGRLGDPAAVDASLAHVARNASPETLRAHVKTETQRVDGDATRRDEARQQRFRRMSFTEQPDGMWSVAGALPHEIGIKAQTALNALMTKDPVDTPDELRRSHVQRTADAFNDLCDLALDHGHLPAEAGQARPHVSVVVDVDLLTAELADESGTGPLPNDHPLWADLPGAISDWSETPLSPQATLRLCCDAAITRVVMAKGQVIDVGRATRTWSAPQRTAINVRDGRCRGPSCDRPIRWTQIHHVTWWRHEGRTDVANGLALCHHCHHKVHDLAWQVDLDPTTAVATWTSPTGTEFVNRPARPPGRRRRTG